ncbi:hypothetical protein ACFL0Y_02315 [Patescibacteria group bacterium]
MEKPKKMGVAAGYSGPNSEVLRKTRKTAQNILFDEKSGVGATTLKVPDKPPVDILGKRQEGGGIII